MVDHEYFDSPQVNFQVSITALMLLVVVGVFSGMGPALRAVRIRPVEALRAE
jgi:putative ABC transport system permease protein